MTTGAPHIFISHGSDDRAEADEIARYLEERGLRVWIAPRDVRPGRDYSEQLQEAIETCAAFVVLVSDRANKSPYVRVETELAFSGNIPIFPVRTSKVEPGAGLALFLKIKHWTDSFGPQRDYNLERLAAELQLLAGQPAEADGEAQAAPPAPPPTAAPPPPPAPPPPAGREEALRAFVGPNADYYLAKRRQMESSGSGTSWNWAAFLLNGIWLAYRKMWVGAAAFVGGFTLLYLLATALIAFEAVEGLLPLIVVQVLGAGAAAWLGLNGNRLYLRQADSAIAEAGQRDRGGTSLPAAIAIGLAWAAVLSAPYWIGLNRSDPSVSPASAVTNGIDKPDPGAEPLPGDQGGGALALTPDYLIGRWGDNGDCSVVLAFGSDGTVHTPDNAQGRWSVSGDTLTVEGPAGASSVRIEIIDRDRFRLVGEEGETVRCD
ncbi:TIR domain-containing protein [Allosphingosinicella sp.]|jgi:hypothetical protein|uniref:TIR domain-containing protein n=1 Tax=Allosphingosinicella sp. TaxID=2823234 RepID=UPI002EDC7207